MNLGQRKESLFLSAFILLALFSVFCFFFLYRQVSPSASLNFKISRLEAQNLGENFLKSLSIDSTGFQSNIAFFSEQDEAIFIEKSLGTEKANQFFAAELAPWYWRVRWYQPLKEEEMILGISPDGKIVKFEHWIPQDQAGLFLTRQEAQEKVEQFLQGKVDLNQWALISYEQKDQKQRRDHEFRWAKKGVDLKGGAIELTCRIWGGEIGGFYYDIRIPPAYEAKEAQTESKRKVLTLIFYLFQLALGFVVGAEFLLSLLKKKIPWKAPLILAGVMFVLTFLSEVNNLPLGFASLDTRESAGHFLLSEIFSSLLSAFWSALFVLMIAVAAETLQSITWPKKPRLQHIFSKPYFLSLSFPKSILIGYGLGCLQLGYVAIYYLIGHKVFGAWSPLESPYYNVASSAMPWIFPLTIGLSAALTEELFFRMFAISFLKRVLRSDLLAVILPAVIWGFMHSNYYVEPIYSRGVELSVVGIVLGFIYLQYGILPTILCHYTYNSILGLIPLLRSETLFYKASGLISVFWLMLPALLAILSFIYIKKKRMASEFVVPEEPLPAPQEKAKLFEWGERLNYDFFAVSSSEPTAQPLEKTVYSWKQLTPYLGLGTLLLFLAFTFFPSFYGPFPDLKIGKKKAFKIAEQFLKENQITLNSLRSNVGFYRATYSTVGSYLLRQVGTEKTNEILAKERLSFFRYGILFYEIGKQNKMTVSLDAEGRVIGLETVWDDGDGVFAGSLSLAEAREKAASFLLKMRSWDAAEFQFVGEKSLKLKDRTDHGFVWEKRLESAPEIVTQIRIQVKGTLIGAYHEDIEAPESFVRHLNEKKGREIVVMILFALLLFVGTILIAWDAIMKFRKGLYDWKVALIMGLVFLSCDVLEKINGFPQMWLSLIEGNSMAPWLPLTEKLIRLAINEIIVFGFIVFFTCFALALIKENFGSFSFSFLAPKNFGKRGNMQGMLLALLSFPLLWAAQFFLFSLEEKWVPQTLTATYPFLRQEVLNSWWPALGIGTKAIKDAILFSLTIGGVLAFLFKILKREIFVFLFIAATGLLPHFSSQLNGIEMILEMGIQTVIIAILFLMVRKSIRFNLMFYLFFFWVRSLFPHLALLWSSDPFLFSQGVFAVFLVLCPLGIGLIRAKKESFFVDRGLGKF